MTKLKVRALVASLATLLFGCTPADAAGRSPPATAMESGRGEPRQEAARPAGGAAATAGRPFVQVLRHERELQDEVDAAFRAWAMPRKLSFPMDPDRRVRVATGVHVGAAAMRALAGREREVIGWATFTAGRPDSYEHFSATRAFRMVLGPDGAVRRANLERDLDESAIVKPAFTPVDEAEARALKRRLDLFLAEPAQARRLENYLWAAIAGRPTTHTYVLHAVKATNGDFGAFGRIVRFRGTLERDGQPVVGYTSFEIEVVTDRTGRVIAAGDPTS